MTDKEIIKALEDCSTYAYHYCSECGFKDGDLLKATLDLINRQKAEIERLQSILLRFMDEVAKWEEKYGLDVSELPLIPICDEGRDIIDHYRKRAIEQFAERLKKAKQYSLERHENIVPVAVIDWIVKEMVGDTE